MEDNQRGLFKRVGESLGFLAAPEIEERATGTGVIPPARSDISSITPEVALQIGAVHRAISIIVASVSQMDLGVFRNGVEIRTPLLVRQPNPNDSQKAFIEETVFSLAAHGNAYWFIYDQGGKPSLEVLDPTSVTVVRENGQTKYWIGTKAIPAGQIKHLKLMRKPGHVLGYGPIQHGQSELIGAVRLRNFADNWFNISGVPQGILTTDQTLGPEEAKAFADAWAVFIKDNGTAIMSQGMRYELLSAKPAELQMLEVQQAHVVGIARLFGVPAMHLLAELTGTSNTYLNLEQANIVFLQTTLVKYINEIEEALSSLLPYGQRVQFKEEGLLRMDSVTKWQVIKTQVDVGYTSGEEMRKAEGKPALPTPKAAVGNQANSNKDNNENGQS